MYRGPVTVGTICPWKGSRSVLGKTRGPNKITSVILSGEQRSEMGWRVTAALQNTGAGLGGRGIPTRCRDTSCREEGLRACGVIGKK